MKNLASLIVLLSFIALAVNADASGKKRYAPAPEVTSSPSPLVSPSPRASATPVGAMKVVFQPDPYYSTPAERAKIASAGKLLNEIIATKCFHDFIANRKLIQTDGRTPAQVADHLQSLTGVVPVIMYYRRMGGIGGTSAVAYRNVGEISINLNRAYFSVDMPDAEWAATLGHESVGHSLGEYDHDYNWSPSRSFSVPYSIGGADAVSGGDAIEACSE